MEYLIYILKVGIIYTILYLIYFLLFRKNTNFQTNRTYLLAIIPIAFILPFVNSNVTVNTQYQITLPAFEVGSVATTSSLFNWPEITLYLYISVAALLLVKFLYNIIKTLSIISKIKNGSNKEVQPFSFFSFKI